MRRLISVILALCLSNTWADPLKNLVFFGDSLTDNGNFYRNTSKPKSPPYYQGRFSNGITWAENLTNFYQFNASNFAVGGATVINRRGRQTYPYCLQDEVRDYFKKGIPAELKATGFVIWIGGNDYFDEKYAEPNSLVNAVINELIENINRLILKGSEKFIILDLPDLSKTPYGAKVDVAMQNRLQTLSQLHHVTLIDAIDRLRSENPNLQFIYYDAYHLFNDIIAHTEYYNQKYHVNITNLTDACLPGFYHPGESPAQTFEGAKNSQPCQHPDQYLFWDAIHPSANSHRLLATIIEETLLKDLKEAE